MKFFFGNCVLFPVSGPPHYYVIILAGLSTVRHCSSTVGNFLRRPFQSTTPSLELPPSVQPNPSSRVPFQPPTRPHAQATASAALFTGNPFYSACRRVWLDLRPLLPPPNSSHHPLSGFILLLLIRPLLAQAIFWISVFAPICKPLPLILPLPTPRMS